MKLEPMTMDRNIARRAFIEYRAAVRAKYSDEDAEIMRGYRELAKGRQLISMSQTITAGGVDELGRPRLACCRASARWCWVEVSPAGRVVFSEEEWRARAAKKSVVCASGTLPARTNWLQLRENRALVPPVPPRYRPKSSLENYHVLWEAEWQRVVPQDPALLKHIGGDLYAVLAVWDLTPIERSVLAGRFAARV